MRTVLKWGFIHGTDKPFAAVFVDDAERVEHFVHPLQDGTIERINWARSDAFLHKRLVIDDLLLFGDQFLLLCYPVSLLSLRLSDL